MTAEVIRQIGILAQPVMPGSAAKLLDLLALPEDARDFSLIWAPRHRLPSGGTLPTPVGVFPRYVEPKRRAEARRTAGSVEAGQVVKRSRRNTAIVFTCVMAKMSP